MTASGWHSIVIGSGIGGLACAAALARTGHRVLVLEQHGVAGGLTQTFSRAGFRWDVGVHYVGEMGPQDRPFRLLDWLADGGIRMTPLADVYDVLHFPEDVAIPCPRPEAALRRELLARFPGAGADIDRYFDALREAERAAHAVFAERGMPSLLGRMHGAWRGGDIRRWCGATTGDMLARLVPDDRLRAVLGARWLENGGLPQESSFAMHAVTMRTYLSGAYYPAGGAGAFATALVPVIERAGGAVRTDSRAVELVLEGGRVTGVRLKDGSVLHAAHVISDAGARNTVVRLLPTESRYAPWAQEITALKPSLCHVALYLGLEGDLRAGGAGATNHWFHESWQPGDGVWRRPADERSAPPVLFVSFPSLKDPTHAAGPAQHQTAEVAALVDWEQFARWENTLHGQRPPEYHAFKDAIERNLLAQFRRRFPALAGAIRFHELSTPLSMAAFTGAFHGAMYGLGASPQRFLTGALRPKTPLPGLYFAGQDVTTPGIVGAMMGGLLAAAAVDPRLVARLSWGA